MENFLTKIWYGKKEKKRGPDRVRRRRPDVCSDPKLGLTHTVSQRNGKGGKDSETRWPRQGVQGGPRSGHTRKQTRNPLLTGFFSASSSSVRGKEKIFCHLFFQLLFHHASICIVLSLVAITRPPLRLHEYPRLTGNLNVERKEKEMCFVRVKSRVRCSCRVTSVYGFRVIDYYSL